jgi:streptomycin 6-kinase
MNYDVTRFPELRTRLDAVARRWGVEVEQEETTTNSMLAYGTRDGDAVALKVVPLTSDERHGGALTAMFGTNGMVPVLQHEPGAVLMTRLIPGTQLAAMLSVEQIHAMDDVLAEVCCRLHHRRRAMRGVPRVEDWGAAFAHYLEGGDARLPPRAVERAWRKYRLLCETQGRVTVLHGDLHHYNVLFDDGEGWPTVDPKGVVGEKEFELGVTLRNPLGYPHLYERKQIETRARRFASTCRLDGDRILQWTGVQAVLSVLWSLEDGGDLLESDPAHAVGTALGMWSD